MQTDNSHIRNKLLWLKYSIFFQQGKMKVKNYSNIFQFVRKLYVKLNALRTIFMRLCRKT